MRRTKEDAAITREQLLDAAERVFRQRGVSRTSLAEVATAAGLTRGAIYWHFRDKADLLEAMCARAKLPYESLLERVGPQHQDDPLGLLRALTIEALTWLATDARCRAVFEVMFQKSELCEELADLAERAAKARCSWVDTMEDILKQAIAAGQLPPHTDSRLASQAMHAYLSGLMRSWVQDPNAYDLVAAAPALIDVLIGGLRACPPHTAAPRTSTPGQRVDATRRVKRASPGVIIGVSKTGGPKAWNMSTIATVGIIGAGTMGSGIAQACAVAGIDVTMVDVTRAAVDRGIATIGQSLERLQKKDKITAEARAQAMGRVQGSIDYPALARADLIIEAATENLELKMKILRQADALAGAGAILATNTSSISITQLASVVSRPAQFLGMHFFNPVPMMAPVAY